MTCPGFLFWPIAHLLLMWHYFNDAGQGLMITGIVQIADTWMARHLEPDLHVCDTLLYLATFLCVTSLMTVSHVWCGAQLWPVNTRGRGWYTLISETMTAHGMVPIITRAVTREEQDAGSGARTRGTQSHLDICFTNFLQIIWTHLDMDRFRSDQIDD